MKLTLVLTVACASLGIGVPARLAAAAEGQAAAPAPAQAPPDAHARRGLSVGLRFSLNVPVGDTVVSTSGDVPQHDTSGVGVAVWADVAYRLTPRWYVGGYFQSAFDFSGSTCSTSCQGYGLRFGLDLEHHFAPRSRGDGWVGVGAGYELLHTGGAQLSTMYRGLEFMMLEVGDDVRLGASDARLGPFFAVTGGEYEHIHQTSTSPATEASLDIPNRAVHVWLILGMRARYDL